MIPLRSHWRRGALALLASVILATTACSASTPAAAPSSSTSSPAVGANVVGGAASDATPGGGASGGSPGDASSFTFDGTPQVALENFTPPINGFSFANYTNQNSPSNLTADELRRFWGDQVCASLADNTCVLTPPAQKWMSEVNEAMGGGHCEGMAVLALQFIKGNVNLKDFGDAASASGLKLEGNEKLAKEIAYWWTTQATTPLRSSRLDSLKPSEIVTKLRESFQPGASEVYTFAFFKRDGTGGHAITPYGLSDRGNGLIDVAVYDNNFPNEARVVRLDTANEKWSYNTAVNPTQPPDLYEGDANTKSLWLAPISARLQKQDCPFCGDATTAAGAPAGAAGAKVGSAPGGDATVYNQLFLSPAAGDAGVDVTITDLDGQPLAGVKENPTFAGSGIPPTQLIPTGTPFKVKLDGTKLTAPISTDLTLIGPNTDQFVDGINLDPNQVDTVEFRPAEDSITYDTTGNESPTLGAGFSDPGADYAVGIGGVDLPEGGKVELKMDRAAGTVTITNNGKAKGTYAVAIDRIADSGEELFSHDGVDLDVGDALVLDYGQWAKGEKLNAQLVANGSTSTIELDNTK